MKKRRTFQIWIKSDRDFCEKRLRISGRVFWEPRFIKKTIFEKIEIGFLDLDLGQAGPGPGGSLSEVVENFIGIKNEKKRGALLSMNFSEKILMITFGLRRSLAAVGLSYAKEIIE